MNRYQQTISEPEKVLQKINKDETIICKQCRKKVKVIVPLTEWRMKTCANCINKNNRSQKK